MLRLASLTTFALSLCLVACGTATIANGNGGGGSGGTGGSNPTSSSSSSGTGGSADTCTPAGGTCVPIVPDACMNGTWGDASMYSCGQGVGTGCCLPPTSCGETCNNVGAVRCVAGAVETCTVNPDTNCAPTWAVTQVCGLDQGCNSDGTKCVSSPAATCGASADCGCGCGCVNGTCECTGGLPPSCTSDTECGPTCSGFHCIAGKCAPPACTPGQDQTCNENLAMQSFAGTCNADATCTCKPNFTKKADGKCG